MAGSASPRLAGSRGRDEQIIADLPAGERAASNSSHPRRPTSGSRSLAAQTDGWLYLVTLAKTTGARGDLPALAGLATACPRAGRCAARRPTSASRRRSTRVPPRSWLDGIVVGSRAVQVVERPTGCSARVRRAPLRGAARDAERLGVVYGRAAAAMPMAAPSRGIGAGATATGAWSGLRTATAQ